MDVPGLATDFAIHDERAQDIRFDVNLDLLATERTRDAEVGGLGIFECHRFSISLGGPMTGGGNNPLLPGAELGIAISITPAGDTIVVNHDSADMEAFVQLAIAPAGGDRFSAALDDGTGLWVTARLDRALFPRCCSHVPAHPQTEEGA